MGSLGAKRVRETFNPSGIPAVNKFKRYTADLIDICYAEQGKNDDPEQGRLYSLAMTFYEMAAMYAVKAATAEKEPPT